ncbi:MAG: hypothetical protein P857_295 [Candidatus Xenolissoclinum pacificiensis L6]|uniref:Uncharacterized protein n=1 Tax=Candidatus Xenolissoclinum pacificiensis L6 TaxID=1401685 RepID=W2UZU4_9RICK|nr:MAG: hypothetical protein P857_295 [Candidatus Xenolissoclinum pacificiensis L6]
MDYMLLPDLIDMLSKVDYLAEQFVLIGSVFRRQTSCLSN